MIPPSDSSGSALTYWSASAWTASRPRPAAIATMAPLLSMPRARTPAVAERGEQLAAPAADVEHVGAAREDRHVHQQPLLNRGVRPAKLIFEANVLVIVVRAEG